MKILHVINIALMITLFCNSKTNPEVRKSVLAGTWYTDDAKTLAREIDGYIKKGDQKKIECNPIVLIQPHAGYRYSGQVAASGYRLLVNTNPDVIVILAPSHHEYFRGCSVLPVDYYETPLGRVKVDKEIAKKLLENKIFKKNTSAHLREHAIEIQLPFLQRIYMGRIEKELAIVPVLVGDIGIDDSKAVTSALIKSVEKKRNPLFIISTDFIHYGQRFGYQPFKSGDKKVIREKLRELDSGAIERILKKDLTGFCDYIEKTGATICGRNPLKIALNLPHADFSSQLLSYDTSGNITGDYSNTVSYASILYCGRLKTSDEKKSVGFSLSEKDKKFLTGLARKNIRSLLFEGRNISLKADEVPESCRFRTGVFVTIKKEGNLRGCIGHVIGRKPLYEGVIENSCNAAYRDPRFSPLKKNEFDKIKIEISVLTVPEPVESVDEIKVGRDGLIIEQGFRKGLLLPQVPVEWGWERDEFLVHTCRKAGLPDYAWKHGAKIYRFEAIVFSED